MGNAGPEAHRLARPRAAVGRFPTSAPGLPGSRGPGNLRICIRGVRQQEAAVPGHIGDEKEAILPTPLIGGQ
jgi:hypothetical protein